MTTTVMMIMMMMKIKMMMTKAMLCFIFNRVMLLTANDIYGHDPITRYGSCHLSEMLVIIAIWEAICGANKSLVDSTCSRRRRRLSRGVGQPIINRPTRSYRSSR